VAQQNTAAPVLTVQVDRAQGTISRFVYGVNDGPWAMVTQEMQPQSLAAGATYLRYPAGNWGDQNDLQTFLIDMFISSARQRNAEPSISARLKGSTPAVAAELVRYVNIQKKYGVHYWSVGNEPNLYPNYTVEQYVKDWRAIAQAMLVVDPTIVFVGPDISQYPPASAGDAASYRDWLRAFLKADGDLVSIVSVHRYPFPPGPNQPATTIDQLRLSAREWDTNIPDLRALIKDAVGHDLPIGITEVNSDWASNSGGPASPDSFYNAIWWADVLGRLIRQKVDIVTFFTLSSDASSSLGLLGNSAVRPTYYVYPLYKQFGDKLVASASTDSDVTITAALRSDGKLTLMIVNPAEQSKTVTLAVSGITVGSAELWRLDTSHNATKIGNNDEIGAGTLNLPAQSASLYIVSAK
jgi:hypothetical protein